MFKISHVNDEAIAKAFLSDCKAEKVKDAFLYAMTDIDTADIMGICQFEILDDCGYIYDLKPKSGTDDFEAMFILGRQSMNFINLCGHDTCRAALEAADNALITAIGFKRENECFICDMKGMFDGSHCSGHKKD